VEGRSMVIAHSLRTHEWTDGYESRS